MAIGRRQVVFAAVVATAAASVVVLGASPAAADGPCWRNGADMPGETCGRPTFILDPGLGNKLDRGAILAHQSYYQSHGFSPNFLWYAPQAEHVVMPGSTQEWSHCRVNMPVGQICSPGAHDFNPVLGGFSDDDDGEAIRIESLVFGSAFIALACGNFSAGGAEDPVPVISGHKFHDRDRDGVRDAGEPGLAGWTMTLTRDRSDAGQGLGAVASTVTDANGYYEFRLHGHYPGDYAVTEENRADWAGSPSRHTLRVDPAIGAHHFAGLDFGNVETKADAVKVSFAVVDPPAEMPADAETVLRVRAVLENRGPAPIIDVVDAITASGPEDCAFRPVQQSVTRRLTLGTPVEVVFDIGVTCAEPSFHPLEFANALTVTTPGVTDPDLTSNRRVTGATIAVIDESDVAVAATRLDCVSRTYVDDHFSCTATASVVNHGDHAPALADVALALTGPADCVLTPVDATDHEVALTDAADVATTWDVVCADRSYHDFRATAQIRLDHLHVIDPDPADNDGAADARVEVFEPVDLSIADLRITCDEREHRTTAITCVSTVTVANAGPATDVRTLTTVGFTAPADCAATPASPQTQSHVLAAGSTATFTKTWTLSCDPPRRHTFTTTATIGADEPHPEDTLRDNDTASISWQPIDVKPRSNPSSINLNKEGVVPVAVLSTDEFDAVAQIDPATVTFGATGTEPSLVRCATVGEDVNGDGLLDLICHFSTAATALTCTSTTATLMARTFDGHRVEGQDDIKTTGC